MELVATIALLVPVALIVGELYKWYCEHRKQSRRLARWFDKLSNPKLFFKKGLK